MTAIQNITSALKSFSGKPMAVTSKALGVATCAAVLYDAHINGRERAYSCDEIESGDRFYNQYKQYMTCEKESATICKFKKIWFDMQQSFPLNHIGPRVKGYASGFGKTLLTDLPLIGLSAVSLKCKTLGKIAGVGLALNAVKTLAYDVMGIGAKKAERHY